MELWVNDLYAGVRICPPYDFHIEGLLKEGINKLTIDVTNTLANEQRDGFSFSKALEPSGLFGPIRIM